jgi:hypothetical protein
MGFGLRAYCLPLNENEDENEKDFGERAIKVGERR